MPPCRDLLTRKKLMSTGNGTATMAVITIASKNSKRQGIGCPQTIDIIGGISEDILDHKSDTYNCVQQMLRESSCNVTEKETLQNLVPRFQNASKEAEYLFIEKQDKLNKTLNEIQNLTSEEVYAQLISYINNTNSPNEQMDCSIMLNLRSDPRTFVKGETIQAAMGFATNFNRTIEIKCCYNGGNNINFK